MYIYGSILIYFRRNNEVSNSFVMIFLTVACAQGVKDVELKTFDDSVSYAIGADIARNFKAQEMDINNDAFVNGFMDIVSDGEVKNF